MHTATPKISSVSSIANPDNIGVRANGEVVIGEDTGRHENDMLWLLEF